MCAEWDGAAGVRGHQTMNLPIPVVGARLWALWEPLWGHVLNICRPYFSRDEQRFEFPPNRHLIQSFKTIIPRMSFWFHPYFERSSFLCAWYLRVNWTRCEGTPLLRCETALEEVASQVGADSSPWSVPKDTSSSLLEELAATVYWRRAVDFILRIYTIYTNNYIINFDYFKNIRQHLPYTEDYPQFSNLQIFTITTNQLTPATSYIQPNIYRNSII